jgi:hypothetical protein
MDTDEPRSPTVEKDLFTKLTSLGNEEIDEMERLRKKFNVMEVKIDDIYRHLLSSRTTDPRKGLIDKINLVSAALLTVGLIMLLIGLMLPEDALSFASVGISAAGLALMYTSIRMQSSRKEKDASKRAD